MHAEQNFEGRIRTALKRECDSISASEELKSRIDKSICAKQEENSMKHMSVKKLCISVAAACLLVSGVTAFAGGASYFIGSSGTEPEYTNYQDMEKAEKQLGYAVDSVEQFANGFSFAGVSVETIDACTEENGKMYSIPSMDVRYRKDGKMIDLNVNEKVEDTMSAKEPDDVRMCGDIELRYDEYTNKLVPDSYELTEEDKLNEQRDDYNIVYMSVTVNQDEADAGASDDVKQGGYVISGDSETISVINRGEQDQDDYFISGTYEEICIQQVSAVSWEKDGISYNLTGTDLDMSAEEMLDMAEEILTAE